MAVAAVRLVLFVALVAGSSGGAWAAQTKEDGAAVPAIHALRPMVGSGDDLGVPCDSWRLAVETNNKRNWKTVPASCEDYVGHYMLGQHYRRDSTAVVDEAVAYAEGLELGGEGREVWVFDIDETSLSNLPYYATHGFGYVTLLAVRSVAVRVRRYIKVYIGSKPYLIANIRIENTDY
ncbi:unnamed protein product [Urochloa humidicola]